MFANNVIKAELEAIVGYLGDIHREIDRIRRRTRRIQCYIVLNVCIGSILWCSLVGRWLHSGRRTGQRSLSKSEMSRSSGPSDISGPTPSEADRDFVVSDSDDSTDEGGENGVEFGGPCVSGKLGADESSEQDDVSSEEVLEVACEDGGESQ